MDNFVPVILNYGTKQKDVRHVEPIEHHAFRCCGTLDSDWIDGDSDVAQGLRSEIKCY